MIAKKYKLPVTEVKNKRSRVYRKPYFTIKVFLSDKNYSRFGVIVSKKNFARAVDRNKYKRMIFQAVGVIIDKWPTADYLIILTPTITSLNQKQINDEFVSQLFI